jgi:hypothetical protein
MGRLTESPQNKDDTVKRKMQKSRKRLIAEPCGEGKHDGVGNEVGGKHPSGL